MEILTHTTIRMSLEDSTLSEISQSQHYINTYMMFVNMELMADSTRVDKFRDRKRDGVARGCGRGESGLGV